MSAPTTTLVQFDIPSASDDLWQQFVTIRQTAGKERNPNEPVVPAELIRKSLIAQSEMPHGKIEIILAMLEDTAQASLLMQFATETDPDYEDKKHAAFCDIYVVPEHRQQGVGQLLVQHAVATCQEKAVSVLQVETDSDAGEIFAESLGGQLAIRSRNSRAYLKDIDWGLMQQWVADCQAKNPDVRLETHEDIMALEEETFADYVHVYSEVLNQQPLGDLEGAESNFSVEAMREEREKYTEMGAQVFTKITREADGKISGITELFYHPQRGFRINQGLTGVQELYRGRSLGKWLKADMALYARDKFPDVDFISTDNANINEAMLSINVRMGFKLHLQSTVYKFQVDDLAEKL